MYLMITKASNGSTFQKISDGLAEAALAAKEAFRLAGRIIVSRAWYPNQAGLPPVVRLPLQALTLDKSTAEVNLPVTINIVGARYGSVITLTSGTMPPGLTLDSAARTISGTPTTVAAAASLDLTETKAGSAGSPKVSSVSIEITAAPAPPEDESEAPPAAQTKPSPDEPSAEQIPAAPGSGDKAPSQQVSQSFEGEAPVRLTTMMVKAPARPVPMIAAMKAIGPEDDEEEGEEGDGDEGEEGEPGINDAPAPAPETAEQAKPKRKPRTVNAAPRRRYRTQVIKPDRKAS